MKERDIVDHTIVKGVEAASIVGTFVFPIAKAVFDTSMQAGMREFHEVRRRRQLSK